MLILVMHHEDNEYGCKKSGTFQAGISDHAGHEYSRGIALYTVVYQIAFVNINKSLLCSL